MILDTSAILAVIFREPGFEDLLDKITNAPQLAIGAPSLAEAGIVIAARLKQDSRSLLLHLVGEWHVVVIPFGEHHWSEAVEAYSRFGRGNHKASLNFGDCMTYAIAKLADEALLCTGSDFTRTDLKLA